MGHHHFHDAENLVFDLIWIQLPRIAVFHMERFSPIRHPSWPLVKNRLIAVVESTEALNAEGLCVLIKDIYSFFCQSDSGGKFDDIPRMLEALPRDVSAQFLITTIPQVLLPIIEKLPYSFIQPEGRVPTLRQNETETISMSPLESFMLISLSFLCIPLLLPNGSPDMRDTTFQLFFTNRPRLVAKLHCIVNYLNLMASAVSGTAPISLCNALLKGGRKIEIQRLVSTSITGGEWWADSTAPMRSVEMKQNYERIESAQNAVHADFANKQIGGGVLRRGCVQEEIRFMVSPECLVAVLLSENLLPHEAIVIRNTLKFNDYEGYSASFRCKGFNSTLLTLFENPAESFLSTDDVLCIDAIPFGLNRVDQFRIASVVRELEKCRVGLSYPGMKPFATGNWGCGVFGGDTQLKAVIQWLACSVCGRDMIFHPFEDSQTTRLGELVRLVAEKEMTTGHVFRILLRGLSESQIQENSCLEYLLQSVLDDKPLQ